MPGGRASVQPAGFAFVAVMRARIQEDAVKYMLLMRGGGTDSAVKAAARVCEAGWMPWVSEMQERGVVLHGGGTLATVDTLITAGIGNSRAEVLRWAVGRIRERPAYAQLQERVHEIDELKAQF